MKIGFTIGKFAPLHKGHQYLIEKGLSEMDEFYVIIYETNLIEIPINKRANWIKKLHPKVKVIYAENPPTKYGLDEESIKIQIDYLRDKIQDIPVTHFYNSEKYGKFVVRDLNIKEVQVDNQRIEVPVSATKIREDIEKYREYINQCVYEEIVIANEEDASDVFGIKAENTEVTTGIVQR